MQNVGFMIIQHEIELIEDLIADQAAYIMELELEGRSGACSRIALQQARVRLRALRARQLAQGERRMHLKELEPSI